MQSIENKINIIIILTILKDFEQTAFSINEKVFSDNELID